MTGPRGDLGPEVGGLGQKQQHPEPPREKWMPHAPGVERDANTGRLRTNAPPPPPPEKAPP